MRGVPPLSSAAGSQPGASPGVPPSPPRRRNTHSATAATTRWAMEAAGRWLLRDSDQRLRMRVALPKATIWRGIISRVWRTRSRARLSWERTGGRSRCRVAMCEYYFPAAVCLLQHFTKVTASSGHFAILGRSSCSSSCPRVPGVPKGCRVSYFSGQAIHVISDTGCRLLNSVVGPSGCGIKYRWCSCDSRMAVEKRQICLLDVNLNQVRTPFVRLSITLHPSTSIYSRLSSK